MKKASCKKGRSGEESLTRRKKKGGKHILLRRGVEAGILASEVTGENKGMGFGTQKVEKVVFDRSCSRRGRRC